MENTYESIVLGTAAKDGRVFTSDEETTFRMFNKMYFIFFIEYIQQKNHKINAIFHEIFFIILYFLGLINDYMTLIEETSIHNPYFGILYYISSLEILLSCYNFSPRQQSYMVGLISYFFKSLCTAAIFSFRQFIKYFFLI